MTDQQSPEPLHRLIRKIRHPAALRELMAACLRSAYMGDPFAGGEGYSPNLPEHLLKEVVTAEETISGIRCVIYTPKDASGKLPFMLYMHGGGFVIGSSEDTDYVTRMLCYSNRVVVVSVNYRLAPETVFPGALADCEQVLNSVIAQSAQLGINPNSGYLAGDSAGANLAIALYCRARGHREAVKGLILLAPWLDMNVENYDSFNRLAPSGVVFDSAFLAYARAAYTNFEQWKNPEASPLFSLLTELPPTMVHIGTEDPLIDQSLRLQENALVSGCNQIEIEIYSGMPHCFYSFPNLYKEEQDCYKRISDFIARTLA